jgi:hypothetical protein
LGNYNEENVNFISFSQELDIEVDFDQIDDRLAELDDRFKLWNNQST